MKATGKGGSNRGRWKQKRRVEAAGERLKKIGKRWCYRERNVETTGGKCKQQEKEQEG